MGTFAGIFWGNGTSIPKEKTEEFRERIEQLYQAGGMMELERVSLFGVRKSAGGSFTRRSLRLMCWRNYMWTGQQLQR